MNTAADDRRSSRQAGSAAAPGAARTMLVPRDLPVLFQMPDVSVAKAKVPEPAPEKSAAVPPPPPRTEPAAKMPVVELTTVVQPKAETPTKPMLQEVLKAAASEAPPAKSAATTTVELNKPTAKPEAKTTPRRATKGGPWFDGQGKLITVCFLIALIATIYFARSAREPKPAPQQTAWPETHPGDAAQGKTPAALPLPPSPIPAEPPKLTNNPESPRTELLPPAETAPPVLAAQPPTPAGSPEEPRTAALPPPIAAGASTAPPLTPAPPRSPPPDYGTPPPVGPTPAPPPESPPSAPPPGYPAYPSTAPNNYPSTGAAPAAGVPSYPSPSGTRYERTGSGLY